jgi:hypothetical protein
MDILLTVTQNCTGEGGIILVQRKNGEGLKDIGTIKFKELPEKKWLINLFMEYHKNVSLVPPLAPCNPNEPTAAGPC